MAHLGQTVIYKLSSWDAEAINRRRIDARKHREDHHGLSIGYQVHVGNNVEEGEEYPMVITRVWNPTYVNGQVMLDGNDLFWATSRSEGINPGDWRAL